MHISILGIRYASFRVKSFTNKADIQKLPNILQDLYDRSSKNLTSEEHKKKLKELLNTNKDAFETIYAHINPRNSICIL
jgi:cell shape-determining protein MreC